MIHRFRVPWVGLAGVMALSSAASADVLHLKTGGQLEGVLIREDASSVTIDVGMGQVSIPRSALARIEQKESALSEFRNRLGAIGAGDVQSYIVLARYASAHGLRGEARLMWARVVSLDPRNAEAHQALGHVLVAGNYMEEEEAYRANGFVHFDGRWMTMAEQSSLLREREQRATDDRRVDEARRAARDAEDRARRAEADAAQARAAAANTNSYQVWGYGGPIIGSRPWGGYTAGCSGASCNTVPQIWTPRPPAPAATPMPRTAPIRPSGFLSH